MSLTQYKICRTQEDNLVSILRQFIKFGGLEMSNLIYELKKIANTKTDDQFYKTKEAKNNFYWSKEWKSLKRKIINRDNSECQVCKSEGKVTLNNLIVHHIHPLEFYSNKSLDEDNLITVCMQCHNTIHSQSSTKQWDDEWW